MQCSGDEKINFTWQLPFNPLTASYMSTSHSHLMSTWGENGHLLGGNKICYFGSKIHKCHNFRMAAVRFDSVRTKSGSGSHRFRFTRNSGSKRFRFTPVHEKSKKCNFTLYRFTKTISHVRASGGSSTSKPHFVWSPQSHRH